jgi:flagellar motor switch/type III secretory pathway protein FliN
MATVLALPNPKVEEPGASEAVWREASWLPCRLSAEVAMLSFTVGDLLSLEVNSVLSTRVSTTGDLHVRVNGEIIARAELDSIGNRLAVRLTELA